MKTGRVQLYHLETDLPEEKDLAASRPDLVAGGLHGRDHVPDPGDPR
jgi:hypothetical protein